MLCTRSRKKKPKILNSQIFIILTEQVTSESISVIICRLSHNQHFVSKKSVELHFLSAGTIINIHDLTACRRLDSSESVNTNILCEGSMGKNPPSCPVMKRETNEMRVRYDYCWVFTARLVTPRQQLHNKSMRRYREGSTTPVVCNDTINHIILMTGL